MSRLEVERILLERARLYFTDIRSYADMIERFDMDSLIVAVTDEHGALRLIDDESLFRMILFASRSRMVQDTPIPCPAWCKVRDSQDGKHHGFTPTTTGSLTRHHERNLGEGLTSVTIVLAEHAPTVEGPTIFGNNTSGHEPDGTVAVIYADVDDAHINPLTGPEARELAVTLVRAAEAWDELQALVSS